MLFYSSLAHADTLRIAVASNFKSTLEMVNASYPEAYETTILLSSASTGTLANQVRYGAPYDVFFAADATTPQDLAQEFNSKSFCYARGRLALVGGSIAELAAADKTLAIANPITAPYGRAAMEVLAREEFSAAAARTLVRGNNAAQAYQFWHSKSVDLALVPLALVQGHSVSIPSTWHSPIEQHAVVLNHSEAVQRYVKWLGSDRVRSLIQKVGYQSCP